MIQSLEKKCAILVKSKTYSFVVFVCCLLYIALALPNLEIYSIFKNIIIFGSIPYIYLLSKEGNKDILYLFIGCFTIQTLSWINSLYAIPNAATPYPDMKLLASLFLFFPMSFFIRKNNNKRIVLFSTFLISFLITVLVHDYNYNSLSAALNGVRVDFGLHNAQYTSMMAAVAAMVSSLLFFLIKGQKYESIIRVILGISFAFWMFILMASQSRQIWLSLTIVLLSLPVLSIKKIGRKNVLGLYLILLSLGFLITKTETFNDRMLDTKNSGDLVVAKRIIAGDWQSIPMTSFGIRFNSWQEAYSWIKENPILGTTKAGVKELILESKAFQSNPRTSGFGHLHNYYIETLVSFGIVGMIFLICFYFTIFKNAFSREKEPSYIFVFSFLILWLLINNFESYNSKYYGLYIFNLVLSCYYLPPEVGSKKGKKRQ
ncbi:O-antigen ligase family protein [Salinivibrio sp. AR640]|uniref:O-antigen ligase family protein n=1 Tax=Salinivibrio sp. AR640 TaxID=1909437 RepID=UPI0009849CD8|nr:O-antigen ligase family protein [Salinivibrio sp. AR640]OOE94679.1 hypothetical protein BZG75_04925 [Salinivibrio sp. AR640]